MQSKNKANTAIRCPSNPHKWKLREWSKGQSVSRLVGWQGINPETFHRAQGRFGSDRQLHLAQGVLLYSNTIRPTISN